MRCKYLFFINAVISTHHFQYSYLTSIFSYEEVSPGIFRVGDIVEARFAVVAVPMKASPKGPTKFRMRLVLRSLCLEDSSEIDVSKILFTSHLQVCLPETLGCLDS